MLAGMPPPDPAALADSIAAMSVAGNVMPVIPAASLVTAPSDLVTSPAAPLAAPSEPPVAAPVLNPAVLAGMPPPDPALLASMNLTMPQV